MTPQQRVSAILASQAPTAWKALLIAIGSHFSDDRDTAWASPETLASMASVSLSTARSLLAEMVSTGVISRYEAGHKAKDTAINWSILATYKAPRSGRGGKRQPSEHRTEGSEHRTVPSGLCPTTVRSLVGQPSDVRTRTDQGTDQGTDQSLGGAFAPPLPPEAPKPARAPKPKAAKPRTAPGYSEAVEAWDRTFREAFSTAYPWSFVGRDHDGARVKAWLAAGRIGPEADAARVEQGIAALESGMRAYLARVAAGSAWPRGEPATTRVFTSDLSRWLQTDPSAAPPQREDRRSAALAAIEGAQRQLHLQHAQEG